MAPDEIWMDARVVLDSKSNDVYKTRIQHAMIKSEISSDACKSALLKPHKKSIPIRA